MSTLGGPPGDYSKGLVVPFSERMDFNAFDWISDDGKIRVWFSEDNKVEKCEFQRVTIWKLTWRDMIRRRFGL